MRRTLGLLVTGTLRSRLGVAVALTVIVFGIVGAARLLAGSADDRSGVSGQPAAPITTVDPNTGNDGMLSNGDPATPRSDAGGQAPESVAKAFAAAWLRRDLPAAQWQSGLAPHITDALAGRLADADPAGVPAERVTGDPLLTPQTADLAQVTLPVDTGTLNLQLTIVDRTWRVDAVDWERAS